MATFGPLYNLRSTLQRIITVGDNALVTATGIMMNRSMYKNCLRVSYDKIRSSRQRLPTSKSPKDEANEYNKVIVVN